MCTALIKGYCLSVNKLVYGVGYLASFLMPLLAAAVAFEVFSRYVLGSPTVWAYDVSLFLFGYIAALCGALAQQKKSHINVDVFYLSVSARMKSIFNLISYLLSLFFLCVVAKMAFGKFEEAVEFGYRRQSEWAPSMVHFWVMIVTASCLFILQYISDAIQDIYFLFTEQSLLDPFSQDREESESDDSTCTGKSVESL
ncbi:TRAP transporter small permease subunit [Aliivibrio kagoshimensis]|uniref:TRAP transporter small permease subunit n=1 Tax=Aliivibrio kagoshimensis TaxID=2910230 RepID=UPI003D131770